MRCRLPIQAEACLPGYPAPVLDGRPVLRWRAYRDFCDTRTLAEATRNGHNLGWNRANPRKPVKDDIEIVGHNHMSSCRQPLDHLQKL